MDKRTKARWLEHDLWSEREFGELLAGLTPNTERPSHMQSLLYQCEESIRRGVIAHELPCVSPADADAADKLYGNARFFRPKEAIRWAGDRFQNFPFRAVTYELDAHEAALIDLMLKALRKYQAYGS